MYYILVLFILSFSKIDASRILAVIPTPSVSHQVVFRPIIQELVKRGHEVVVVTTDPVFPKGEAPANLTEIDVHDLSYSIWKSFIENTNSSSNDWVSGMETFCKLMENIFEEQMNSKQVQESLFTENAQFDLLIVEAWVKMTLALSYLFKAPVIQVSSAGSPTRNTEIMGAPSHPFLYPTNLRRRIQNLNIWEKLTELYSEIKYYKLLQSTEEYENIVIKRLFGPDTPPLNELNKKVEMLFLNVHPIWEDNRPVPPNVIFLGGLHQNDKKKLPTEIQSYLDSSKNGVIYVSFGTNVQPSLLPLEKIKTLTNVFSQLPYDVLFKWDKDELPGRSKNVKISKWLPQADLLRHKNIKLFITQGGLQSTDEAITAGVPLIGIPMLADQWYNVEKYTVHKIGIGLDMQTLSEEKLKAAIEIITDDNSYRQNIVNLRNIMEDQPQRPLDRAVWWIEHVLRHGGSKHLRTPVADMNWTDYLELKLVFLLVGLLLLTLAVLYFVALFVWRFSSKYIANIKLKIA